MARARTFGLSLLARACLYFLLYILLVDDLLEPELVTGAVTAVGAALFAQVLFTARPGLRVRPAMLRLVYRPLLLLFTDTIRVSVALLRALILRRPLQGRLRAERYRATSEEEPEDVGRRALTQWAASLGANRYVLGIDPERQLLIVHELVDAPGPLDPLELG